jgi:hypothetical protein
MSLLTALGDSALSVATSAGENELGAAVDERESSLNEKTLKVSNFMLSGVNRLLSSPHLRGSPTVRSLNRRVSEKIESNKAKMEIFDKDEKKAKFKRALSNWARKKATIVAASAYSMSAAISCPAGTPDLTSPRSTGRAATVMEAVDSLSSAKSTFLEMFSPKSAEGDEAGRLSTASSVTAWPFSMLTPKNSLFSPSPRADKFARDAALDAIEETISGATEKGIGRIVRAGAELGEVHVKSAFSSVRRNMSIFIAKKPE